jgi:hypothetical protein
MEEPGDARIYICEFVGNHISGFIATDLLFQSQMLDDPRHYRTRLQAGAGVVEEDGLLAAGGVGSQLIDVPDLHAGFVP